MSAPNWKYALSMGTRDGEVITNRSLFFEFEAGKGLNALATGLELIAERIEEFEWELQQDANGTHDPDAVMVGFTIERQDEGARWVAEGTLRHGDLFQGREVMPVNTVELMARLVEANVDRASATTNDLLAMAAEAQGRTVEVLQQLHDAVEKQREAFTGIGIHVTTDLIEAAMENASHELELVKTRLEGRTT